MNNNHDISDEELMKQFKKTLDNRVFHDLASRHYALALSFAGKRLSNHFLAQEAVQEALCRVVRYRRRYKPSKPFQAWFITILRNVCTDIYRKEATQKRIIEDYAERQLLDRSDHSTGDLALEIVKILPEADAHLIELRYVQGMRFAEIAEKLDCTEETAKKRFQRLIKRLKKRLKKSG
jgi:RNA polymerase sigma-70 factor (ECF subfamily)